MRDPARIDIVLDTIRAYWKAHPDLRLCQIIGNALPDELSGRAYNTEDDELLDALRAVEQFTAPPQYTCYCDGLCKYGPCVDCGEDHGSHPGNRCRDCDIAHSLDDMQCSGCARIRYDDAAHPSMVSFARSVWGDRCTCDPRPPSIAETKP